VFLKVVTLSVFSLSNVGGTTLGAANTMDQIEGGASETLLNLKGVFGALNDEEGGGKRAGVTPCVIAMESAEGGDGEGGVKEEWTRFIGGTGPCGMLTEGGWGWGEVKLASC